MESKKWGKSFPGDLVSFDIELGMIEITWSHEKHGLGHMDRLLPASLTLVIMIEFMYMNKIML